MLNKRFVTIEEEIDGEIYEVTNCVLAVNSDEEYAKASQDPWKFLSGAVRHFLKRIQIWYFRLVEEFTVADIESDAEGVYEEVREYRAFPDTHIITDDDGSIKIYEKKLVDKFRADLSKSERINRLGWLLPYVMQWTLDEVADTITSPNGKRILKAVEVTV